MKNGNTLLFHFELGKKIVVTVFDSTHKQIACSRDQNRIFDLYLLESAVFKGLYDINNEAVMFFEQDMSGKPSLVRMRYNAADGSLIDEKLVGESKNENRRIKYYVMKNKEDDNYEVLFCMDKRHPKESDIFVVYFNNHHQSIKEVRLELERKKYDFLEVIGAESQPNGLFITIGLDKTMLYGGTADLNTTAFAASDHDSDLTYGSSVYQHYISCYFIPKDSTAVKQGLVDLSEGINPYYSLFTWNPLVSSVNLLLYSFKPMNYRFGLDEIYGAASSDIFFKIDQRSMAVDYTLIKNTMANDHLKQQGGKRYFEGMPVKMFTGNNGLSTVVYQSYMRDAQPETGAGYNNNDFTDHIGATNFQGSRGQSYMRDAQPEPGGRTLLRQGFGGHGPLRRPRLPPSPRL